MISENVTYFCSMPRAFLCLESGADSNPQSLQILLPRYTGSRRSAGFCSDLQRECSCICDGGCGSSAKSSGSCAPERHRRGTDESAANREGNRQVRRGSYGRSVERDSSDEQGDCAGVSAQAAGGRGGLETGCGNGSEQSAHVVQPGNSASWRGRSEACHRGYGARREARPQRCRCALFSGNVLLESGRLRARQGMVRGSVEAESG